LLETEVTAIEEDRDQTRVQLDRGSVMHPYLELG